VNLLITNSQEVQAYTILRCLRSEAKKIIITEGGDSVGSTGFQGMAAFSRFVDARYRVPYFAGDWLAGRLETANTPAEEAYIQRIEEICALEGVDVIFPSLDPEVYLFAKNKARLARQGIVTVVPEPEVIRIPMDKGLTIRVAQRVGFPCPKTYWPESEAELDAIRDNSDPPWIVKPRFTAHGAHMAYVDDPAKLRATFAEVSRFQRSPMLQEYIGGRQRQNYYVTLDRDGEILSMLSPQVTRTFKSGYRVACKTCISASTGPNLPELRSLLRELRLWGGYTIQTKIDPRDGQAKLLEINPRLGHHLWWRTGLGVNEPLICLQLARGQSPSGNLRFPDGVIMLDPFHDLFFLYNQVVEAMFAALRALMRPRGDSEAIAEPDNPGGVLATLRLYKRDYLNRNAKLLCPEVRNLLVDPYACLRAFWHKFSGMTGGYIRRALRAPMRPAGRRGENEGTVSVVVRPVGGDGQEQ
jgi:hypothetical protein